MNLMAEASQWDRGARRGRRPPIPKKREPRAPRGRAAKLDPSEFHFDFAPLDAVRNPAAGSPVRGCRSDKPAQRGLRRGEAGDQALIAARGMRSADAV